MSRSPKTCLVQTLSRGLAVLETLYGHEDGLTLHELSQRMKCPKPSLLRLLDTLLARGYLGLDEATGRYALDPLRLLRLTNLCRPAHVRFAAIRSILEGLTERTGETALLAMLDSRTGTAASVEHVEPSCVVRAVPPTYCSLPALRTPLGRACLAESSDAEATETAHRWAQATGLPTEEVGEALADLDTIRSQGYAARAYADYEVGVVAAAVTDAHGQPFGGVVVMAPACRVTDERLREIGGMVCAAAEMLSNLFARDFNLTVASEPALAGAYREP